MIEFDDFYGEYHGHKTRHLEQVRQALIATHGETPMVWFAGDSSLDNKYWVEETGKAHNGYHHILKEMKRDVAYHLNSFGIPTINTAVEATGLRERLDNDLFPQDRYVREFIRPQDTLVVSVGGNDIALKPSASTIWNMGKLIMQSKETIAKGPSVAWGMEYFVKMFRDDVQEYIRQLTEKTKPARVIVCMIYYPDEKPGESWASTTLKTVQYHSNPGKLQEAIRQMYLYGTSQIRLEGVPVQPFGLFCVLDGKKTEDYVAQVEPSDKGGFKIARGLKELLSRPVPLANLRYDASAT